MALLFGVPLIAILSGQAASMFFGAIILYEVFIIYRPLTRFYGRSRGWILTLPFVGLLYMWATFDSALRYWRGQGAMWKGRSQA